MMLKEILADVNAIFKGKWHERDGRQVPVAEDLKLEVNDAVKLSGTVLYADMEDSTGLVNRYKPRFAAEIYKTYLISACRIIRENGGEITAFDGDRVMAVFIANNKNSAATKSALQIKYIVKEINAAMKIQYPSTTFVLSQSIGIDTSDLFVARTGIRNSNDLVWVGRAANYAAKLCALGDSTYQTYITEDVYSQLNESSKYGGTPRKNMWEKTTWTRKGIVVYRSSWHWPLK